MPEEKEVSLQVVLPKELMDRLTNLAIHERDTVRPKQISQFQWLQDTKGGRDLWYDIRDLGLYNHLSEFEVNQMIRQKYRESVGDRKYGPIKFSDIRNKIIQEALEKYLELHIVPPKVDPYKKVSYSWKDKMPK